MRRPIRSVVTRSTARLALAALAISAVVTGCSDAARPPTGPATTASGAAPAAPAIADAPHGGQPGFYFLPPLVKGPPSDTGTFDAALAPEVRICAVVAGACSGPDLVVLTTGGGKGAGVVRVDGAGGAYMVVWQTKDAGLAPGTDYRLSVAVGTRLLGYLDLDVVAGAKELKGVAADRVGLVAGHPLVVRFRIETGIVGRVIVSPASATVAVGGTQSFTATLEDLHGQPLSGPAVSWSSANTDVATVGASGVATGVGAGTTTITATSQQVSGTATLVVEALLEETLSAGPHHSCGLGTSGAAYCWGDDAYQQLGDGSSSVRQSAPVAVAGGLTFRQISAGEWHTCGLTTAGAAYCWGLNNYSQLGDGTNTLRGVPTAVAGGLAFRQISAGYDHSCGVTTAGAAYCWGANAFGKLGDGTTALRAAPTAVVGGLAFGQIAAGVAHTCALTTAGAAYCWGSDYYGQVGDGTTTDQRGVPTPVLGGLTFQQIAVGRTHSCALTTAGAAYCWGRNNALSLGDGTDVDRSIPTAVVGGLTFQQIGAREYQSCGLTTTGAAYCWGQIWVGAPSDVLRSDPTPVAGGLTFQKISVGGFHDCALTPAGAAYCWGSNVSGQLGDGTTVDRIAPTAVVGGLTFR